MEDWDEDLEMWQVREEPSTAEELEREYEQHLVHSQAAGVAQAVHEEMEIMRDAWQASHPKPPEHALWSHGPARDWVASGYDLVHEIYRQQLLQHPPSTDYYHAADWHPPSHGKRMRSIRWTDDDEPGAELAAAPWGVLLDPSLPLGVHWSPADALRLRGVCSSFRGEVTSGAFFGKMLARFGFKLRPHCHDPRRLFELASRVFAEFSFVHSCRTVAARAAGLRTDEPAARNMACVAGSYALHRALQLGDPGLFKSGGSYCTGCCRGLAHPVADVPYRSACEICDPPRPAAVAGGPKLGWAPNDIDVFVGSVGSSRRSHDAFYALVAHAKAACKALFRPHDPTAAVPSAYQKLGLPFAVNVNVDPTVTVKNGDFNGLGGELPGAVEAGLHTPSSRGAPYTREVVLNAAGDWHDDLTETLNGLPQVIGPHALPRAPRPFRGRPGPSTGDPALPRAPRPFRVRPDPHPHPTPTACRRCSASRRRPSACAASRRSSPSGRRCCGRPRPTARLAPSGPCRAASTSCSTRATAPPRRGRCRRARSCAASTCCRRWWR